MSSVPWKCAVVYSLAEDGVRMVRCDCGGLVVSVVRIGGKGEMVAGVRRRGWRRELYLGRAAADAVVACGPVGGCPGAVVG